MFFLIQFSVIPLANVFSCFATYALCWIYSLSDISDPTEGSFFLS